MKIFRMFLFITIFSSLLCVNISNAYETPIKEKQAFTGQPALAGIEQIYVVILRTDFGNDKRSFIWRDLEEKVEKKLQDAGIKTAPASYAGALFKAFNIPELRFSINTLNETGSKQCVFHIQMTLVRDVELSQKLQGHIKAGVWETEPIMKSTEISRLENQISRTVSFEVEKFIQAYLSAKPKDVPAADANLPKPLENKTEISTQKQVKYEYIASKNGKAFHKPECSAAKRIKPDNIKTYESREAVITSGKSPCKLCNP